MSLYLQRHTQEQIRRISSGRNPASVAEELRVLARHLNLCE